MNIHWDKDEAEGTIEASDCGWPAGHWPRLLDDGWRVYTKSAVLRKVEVVSDRHLEGVETDIIEVRYRDPSGRVVRVFND